MILAFCSFCASSNMLLTADSPLQLNKWLKKPSSNDKALSFLVVVLIVMIVRHLDKRVHRQALMRNLRLKKTDSTRNLMEYGNDDEIIQTKVEIIALQLKMLDSNYSSSIHPLWNLTKSMRLKPALLSSIIFV